MTVKADHIRPQADVFLRFADGGEFWYMSIPARRAAALAEWLWHADDPAVSFMCLGGTIQAVETASGGCHLRAVIPGYELPIVALTPCERRKLAADLTEMLRAAGECPVFLGRKAKIWGEGE